VGLVVEFAPPEVVPEEPPARLARRVRRPLHDGLERRLVDRHLGWTRLQAKPDPEDVPRGAGGPASGATVGGDGRRTDTPTRAGIPVDAHPTVTPTSAGILFGRHS